MEQQARADNRQDHAAHLPREQDKQKADHDINGARTYRMKLVFAHARDPKKGNSLWAMKTASVVSSSARVVHPPRLERGTF